MTKIDYHKLLDYSDENIKSLGYASGYNAWENGIGM
jgi:hypothetical protein